MARNLAGTAEGRLEALFGAEATADRRSRLDEVEVLRNVFTPRQARDAAPLPVIIQQDGLRRVPVKKINEQIFEVVTGDAQADALLPYWITG